MPTGVVAWNKGKKITESRKIARKCVTCGKTFLSYPATVRKTKGSALHCSNECRRSRVIKECQICHKEFTVRTCETKFHPCKYCSNNCYSEGKKVTREHYLLRCRAKTRKRRALKFENMGDFDIKYFKWLCARLDYRCVMCNQQFTLNQLTIDHIVPISKGGKHDNQNIQPLCQKCNRAKSNISIFTVPQVQQYFGEYKQL